MLTGLHKALLIPSLGVNHPNLLVPCGLVDVPHPVAQRQALGRVGDNAGDASGDFHARIGDGRPNLFQRPTAIGTDEGGHGVLLCRLRLGLSGRRIPRLCLVGGVCGLELVHEGGAGVAPNIEHDPRQRFDNRRLGRIGRSRLGRLGILVGRVSCDVLGGFLLGGGQLLGRLCRRGQVAILNKRAIKLRGKRRGANSRELRHAERAQVERGSIGRRRALLSRARRDNASRAPLDDPYIALACNNAKVVSLQHRRVGVAIRESAAAQGLEILDSHNLDLRLGGRSRRPSVGGGFSLARSLRGGRRIRFARLCRVGHRFGLCRNLGLGGLPCLRYRPALERVEELRVRRSQGAQRRCGKRGRNYQGKNPCKSDRCAVSFHGWLPFVQTGAAIQCHCIGPSSQLPIPLGHRHWPLWHLMSHSGATPTARVTATAYGTAIARITPATCAKAATCPPAAACPSNRMHHGDRMHHTTAHHGSPMRRASMRPRRPQAKKPASPTLKWAR